MAKKIHLKEIYSFTRIFIIVLLMPIAAIGQADENLEINGFLLSNYTGRTTGYSPPGIEGGDFILAEERFRIDVTAWSEFIDASLRVKGDFYHDAVAKKFDIDLREAYIDYSTSNFDFRLGRQIATWGVGDLLFINDIFPKDWVSFFTGRPMEYLKIGMDCFRTRFTSSLFNAELFVMPFFASDIVPTPGRFFLYNPFAMAENQKERLPENNYENTEFSIRLYRNIGNLDFSVYNYKGFWRGSSMEPDDIVAPTSVTSFFPALSVYGFSAQRGLLKGILSIEAGFYYSRDDESGNSPTVPNSQTRFLAGYQRQLWKDGSLGIQYYVEVMEDYAKYINILPAGMPILKEYRDMITMRLEQLLDHQTWKYSLFVFYSPSDSDYLIRPYVSYKFEENLSGTLGANIFGGKDKMTFLGQFDKNDNIYLSMRFDF